MKCFVTGGTGKLGRVLLSELVKRGHEVRVLVREEEKVEDLPKGILTTIGDLSTTGAIEVGVKGADVVFHCASLVDYKASWEELKRVNVEGTRNLLEACLKTPLMRFVYISSTAVYGKKLAEMPANEGTPTNPTDNYGKSKVEAERVVGEYVSSVPSVIIRPSVIYGPTYIEVYARVLRLLEKGKMPVIGDGKNIIPFVHANDVVEAMIRTTQTDFAIGKTYVISENNTVTQEQIYKEACNFMGKKFEKKQIPKILAKAFISISLLCGMEKIGGEDIDVLSSHRVFNTTRAEKELGWKPKITIYEGIKEMVELYKSIRIKEIREKMRKTGGIK